MCESHGEYRNESSEDVMLTLRMDATLLQSLKKDLALVPCNQNSLSRLIAAIRKIDRIEIPKATKYHGAKFYNVHVFYKTRQSNIPTTRTVKPLHSAKKATPDMVIMQRFSGFSSLRQGMYYHALVGHADDFWPCALCGNMVKLLEHGAAQPRLRVRLFQKEANVCAVLEAFMNSVVRLVADTAPGNRN